MSKYEPGCRNPGDADEDDPVITCWCGERGTFDELFSDDLDDRCGGLGVLHCHCGGDFCVCHHHGEVECPGCEDCEPEGDGDGEGEGWDDYDPKYDDVGGEA